MQRISEVSPLSPTDAWNHGTNVQTAFRISPVQTEAALILMLKKTLMYLDCNKTITGDEDILMAVKHLRETFPAMKLEEWHLIMHRMKTGHYPVRFERLKLPEICAIFQQYEGERAERREGLWNEVKKIAPKVLSDHEVMKMYEANKQRMDEKKKAAAEEPEIERVKTDERGRWQHIPYPNSPEDEVQS